MRKDDGMEPSKILNSPPQAQVVNHEGNRSIGTWVALAAPLLYLWFRLIDDLRLEWSTNPEYSYGLVVPLLVVGLLFRRWQFSEGRRAPAPISNPSWAIAVCAVLAFLYLPTCLIQGAIPEWRPLQWSLALETVGLTLGLIYLAGGKTWLRLAAFPVLFILAAVPWPSPVEQWVIQGLSRGNAAGVVNLLFFLSVPAVQHGNVIEVGSGLVGINDACSGIRSLQSSLMISLFLGEFYRFNVLRRLLLLPLCIVLALALNLCRTSLLTWVAAKNGVAAIARYHDEAGITILLICAVLLWGIAWWMHRSVSPSQRNAAKLGNVALNSPAHVETNCTGFKKLGFAGIILLVWFVVIQSGVALWYYIRESQLKPGPSWTIRLPEQNPSFTPLALTTEEHELLRFDEGKKGEWREADGTDWQAFYFNWNPGRVAGYLAKRHTPDICLTATGFKMIAGPELAVLNIHGLQLPVRHYVFESGNGPLQVFQCHWEAGLGTDTFIAAESSRFNLIRGVWAGRGNLGQKSFEIIASGYNDPKPAQEALVRQLNDMVVVQD